MISAKPQECDKFKLMTQRSIKKYKADLTDWQFNNLRTKLPRGIYWFQIEKRGLIHWNWTILQSYLVHGAESPITLALQEEYMATLPKAA